MLLDYFCHFGSSSCLLRHFILCDVFLVIKMVVGAAMRFVFAAVYSHCLCCQKIISQNLIAEINIKKVIMCNCVMYWPYVVVLIIMASCLAGLIWETDSKDDKIGKILKIVSLFGLAVVLIVLDMMLWWGLSLSVRVMRLLIVVTLLFEVVLSWCFKRYFHNL
jgi:hypothetical protein